MNEQIVESGMEFIANNVFHIEKSQALIEAGQGIKCEKFIHSITLYASIVVGVNYNELPEAFVVESKKSIWFVLVIRNHELAWCRYIQTKIRGSLPEYFQKIWDPQVFVINKKSAMKHNLVKKDGE